MAEIVKMFKFFSIADFNNEEAWLRAKSKEGFKLKKIRGLGHYTFEKTDKEDVIYKIDFPNWDVRKDYIKMYEDFGWEFVLKHNRFVYFRKRKSDIVNKNDGEIFSDRQSILEMTKRIFKTFILSIIPMFILFLWSTYDDYIEGYRVSKLKIILSLIAFCLYLYVIFYCGVKLRKIQRKVK